MPSSIFDPEHLHEIAKSVAGLDDRQAACARIIDELKRMHPGHISDGMPWLSNNSGIGMGQMKILHCSMFEYLLLYGTPIGTNAHAGREWTEVWDFVFDGELWCHEEGEISPAAHRPGDVAYLGKGRLMGWAVPDAAFMLEYGRGPVQSMPPFGVADSIFSTLACWNARGGITRPCRLV